MGAHSLDYEFPYGAHIPAFYALLAQRYHWSCSPMSTGTIAGPPSYVADLLHRYHEAGFHHLTLTYGDSPRKRIAVIEEIFVGTVRTSV